MTDKELRELDAWIAEHVMGLRVACGRASHYTKVLTSLNESKNVEMSYAISEYTTDRADAMSVLQKLLEKTTHIEIDFEDGVYHIMEAHEPTLPLVICRAAEQLFSK